MHITTDHCDACEKTNVEGVMYEVNGTPVLFFCFPCNNKNGVKLP